MDGMEYGLFGPARIAQLEQYDSNFDGMEYGFFGPKRIAQLERENLDRYHRSILRTPSYCAYRDDRKRSTAVEDANMDQEAINEVPLQFREETKSEMAEMMSNMAEMKAQLSDIISLLQGTVHGKEATPITPTLRAANEIDDLAGRFPTTVQGNYIYCDSMEDESIENLQADIVAPYAHNLFDEMPRPLSVQLQEENDCFVFGKVAEHHKVCKKFTEMTNPSMEEELLSIKVPMAANYLLDEMPTLFHADSDEGLYGTNKHFLSSYPYIIETSSHVNGSSWVPGVLIGLSKASTQDLSHEDGVLGVTVTNSPSLSKLGFNPQVFDPGTLALFKHEGYESQLSENEDQLHCVCPLLFQFTSSHMNEYIDKAACNMFDNMSKQYSSKRNAGVEGVHYTLLSNFFGRWTLSSDRLINVLELVSSFRSTIELLSPRRAFISAIFACILEDKDNFKWVGDSILVMMIMRSSKDDQTDGKCGLNKACNPLWQLLFLLAFFSHGQLAWCPLIASKTGDELATKMVIHQTSGVPFLFSRIRAIFIIKFIVPLLIKLGQVSIFDFHRHNDEAGRGQNCILHYLPSISAAAAVILVMRDFEPCELLQYQNQLMDALRLRSINLVTEMKVHMLYVRRISIEPQQLPFCHHSVSFLTFQNPCSVLGCFVLMFWLVGYKGSSYGLGVYTILALINACIVSNVTYTNVVQGAKNGDVQNGTILGIWLQVRNEDFGVCCLVCGAHLWMMSSVKADCRLLKTMLEPLVFKHSNGIMMFVQTQGGCHWPQVGYRFFEFDGEYMPIWKQFMALSMLFLDGIGILGSILSMDVDIMATFGILRYRVAAHFSFKDGFNGVLSTDVSNSQPYLKIIPREVALIITVADARGPVYYASVRLFQAGNLLHGWKCYWDGRKAWGISVGIKGEDFIWNPGIVGSSISSYHLEDKAVFKGKELS